MSTSTTAQDFDQVIQDHTSQWLNPQTEFDLRNRFAREGFVLVSEIVPEEIKRTVRAEVATLLEKYAERRDLRLKTTGDTPRFMSVVRSELIADHADVITSLYECPALLTAVERITRERPHSCPAKDEEFLITRQERAGDTHGWHWGDFTFALIWIIDTPDLEHGGMLQCVPHTKWDKENPQINRHLVTHPIRTYGFVPGDIYLLRTDTTLHRTVPLTRDGVRIILNLTWASERDLRRGLAGADRWWEDSNAEAATQVEDESGTR